MKYSSEAETRKHIAEVVKNINVFIHKLLWRSVFHDESKLNEPEKSIFDKYTSKLKSTTYGSEQYKKYLDEMKPALDHHYSNNKHHPEYYFKKYNSGFTGMVGLNDMTLIDIIEMLCDWKAATKRHENGDIIKFIEINQKRFGFSDELKNIFKNTAKELD